MDLRDWVEGAITDKDLGGLDCNGCRLECITEADWQTLATFYIGHTSNNGDDSSSSSTSSSSSSSSASSSSSSSSLPTYNPLWVTIDRVVHDEGASSAVPTVSVTWDDRDCAEHYAQNRQAFMESETKFVNRIVNVHLLRNGVGVPGLIVVPKTTTGDVVLVTPAAPTRKQPSRASRSSAITRGKKEFVVDADFTVRRWCFMFNAPRFGWLLWY